MSYGPRHREDWTNFGTEYYPGGWYRKDGTLYADKTFSASTGKYKIMDDVTVENFYSRSQRGELFNNPCERHNVEILHNPITRTTYQYAAENLYRFSGYNLATPDSGWGAPLLNAVDESLLADLSEEAGTKAYAKVSSSELSLLVTLGELKETKKMLRDACEHLWDILRSVRAWMYLGKKFDDASFWLSIRYGWRPFVAECRAIHKFMTEKRDELAERQTFRSGLGIYNLEADTHIVTLNSGSGTHQYTWRRESQIVGGLSAGILAVQRYAGFPDTLGLTKIPSAVWDLTRLSFVVNWFFNTADIIAAWTPDTLWDPKIGWTSQFYTHSQRNTLLDYECTDTNHDVCVASGGTYHSLDDVYIRVPSVKRGVVPSLKYKFNLDDYKIIDLLALLKQFAVNTFAKRR